MVVGIFAHKVGQYCQYGLMLSRSLVIIQDARPEIGDAPLSFISWMGVRPYICIWPRMRVCEKIRLHPWMW
jgi:hypothetical protein